MPNFENQTDAQHASKSSENFAPSDNTNNASKLSADVNNDHSSWKSTFANDSKMPAGYEKNPPTIDFGKDAGSDKQLQSNDRLLDTKEMKPPQSTGTSNGGADNDARQVDHKHDVDKHKGDTHGNDRQTGNKPGFQIPEGITKNNPIGDLPKWVTENPNPPKLGGAKQGNDKPPSINFPPMDPKWWQMDAGRNMKGGS